MLRSVFSLGATPLRNGAGQPVSAPAWEGAWRRLFSSETSQTLSRGTQRQNSSPLRALRAATRHSAKRPTFGSSGTTFARTQQRGFRFSAWRRSADGAKPQEKLSLSARLKKLSREYGWSAVGVYLGLSVLDFPFCFLLVRIVGTDRIGAIEHYVVSTVSGMIPEGVRHKASEYWHSMKHAETEKLGNDGISEKVEMAGWGVQEAQERNKEEASKSTPDVCLTDGLLDAVS